MEAILVKDQKAAAFVMEDGTFEGVYRITEKIQKPVNILTLPLILCKPLIVKGNVCDRPVGITVIPVMSASPLV